MELKVAVIIAVGMVLLATPTLSRPGGAPVSRCGSMTPGHGTQPSTASPYTISVSGTKYKTGTAITVTVSGGDFMGILMQVRKVGADATPQGTWSDLHADTRLLTCTVAGDSVTHANTNNKVNAAFTWTAPDGVTDDLQVIATVAQAQLTWWKGVTSMTLTYDASLTTTTTATTTTTTTTAPNMSTRFGLSAGAVFMTILVALIAVRFF